MTADDGKDWLQLTGRVGRAAKGTVYCLIGALAVSAASGEGGQVGGSKQAVKFIGFQPLGTALLVVVGIGLLGYAAWKLASGLLDIEGRGRKPKQLAVRAGMTANGLLHCGLALTAIQLATGTSSGNSDGARTWAARLLGEPYGQWVIGIIGGIVVAIGFVQFKKAISKRFMQRLSTHDMSNEARSALCRLGQIGYAARGIVFPIMGYGALRAAWHSDPGKNKDLGDALHFVGSSSGGQALLAIVSAGLLAYGVFMIASAKYHHMPVRQA